MNDQKVFAMKFANVYPLYLAKAGKKGRTQAEVDEVISWLIGYDGNGIRSCLERDIDLETFLREAPRINPNSHLVTGSICGVKLAEIEDPMMLKLRQLDKLVDELAKGKPMEKILRKES